MEALPALADAVHRAFHLAGAVFDGGEAVGHRQPRSSCNGRRRRLCGCFSLSVSGSRGGFRTPWGGITHGIGDIDDDAPASMAAWMTWARKSGSERVASSAENSTPRCTSWRRRPPARFPPELPPGSCEACIANGCPKWPGTRGGADSWRSARLPRPGRYPWGGARKPGDLRPADLLGDLFTDSKSPGELAGKPASMTSTFSRSNWRRG